MKAILMLEDGKGFYGESFTPIQEVCGEIRFNTAVVGYQEAITDPANAGKVVVMTYPLIGNYGVAPKFNESRQPWVSCLIVKELSRFYSNWQARASLEAYVKEHNLALMSGIDTRTLTVHLRQKGLMLGVVSTRVFETKELLARMKAFRGAPAQSCLSKVSLRRVRQHGCRKRNALRLAVLDLGVTNGLLAQLERLGARIIVFPYDTSAQEILRARPAGVIISNGPEADPELTGVTQRIRPLLGKVPILGISTGHQVIAQALGARVVAMKVGHHGANYPIHSPKTFKGEITAQNHSRVVDADSLAGIKRIAVTAYNLNDRTVEEIESKALGLIGVQYLPLSPGFGEPHAVLKRFVKLACGH